MAGREPRPGTHGPMPERMKEKHLSRLAVRLQTDTVIDTWNKAHNYGGMDSVEHVTKALEVIKDQVPKERGRTHEVVVGVLHHVARTDPKSLEYISGLIQHDVIHLSERTARSRISSLKPE